MRFENFKIFLLIILFISLPVKADESSLEEWEKERARHTESYKLDTSFLPDVEMSLTPEDNAWMKQQFENLKNIEPIESNFQTPSPSTNDLIHEDNAIESKLNTKLYIFISFSMPEASLKAWARQAKEAGGTLVLRGFVENSLKKTLEKVIEVLGKDNLDTLTVDPLAFRQFGIHSVPAVVVTTDAKEKKLLEQEDQNLKFNVIYGDVGLSYALKKIIDDGEESAVAKPYLIRLQGTL